MKRAALSHAIRQSLKRLPIPYDNHYGVVPPPPEAAPPSVVSIMDRHSAAMGALVRLDTLVAELRDPWLVSRVLLRREAVSSSAIEGTNSTLDELLSVEEGDYRIGLNDERRRVAAQVKDYALCLETFVPKAHERREQFFTIDVVRDLHRAVMKGDPDYRDEPGRHRDTVVWIGGLGNIAYSTYNPTPPDDVLRCLEDNIAYMRGEGYEINQSSIITRMAVAHAHFEAVHPFRDGNGRVGRLLIPLIMAAAGATPLYLSPFIEANRTAYYNALQASQQRQDHAIMIGFVADAVTATVQELVLTRRALIDLAVAWKMRRRFRAGSAATRALSLLIDYPVVTVRRLAEKLGVSFGQASSAIGQLVDAGILTERTGYSRNRLFAATEVLALINRPFGEEPVMAF